VKINGERLHSFHPSCGIRQGDPLSPYLFIVMANVLSLLMNKAIEDGIIRGIKLKKFYPTLFHYLPMTLIFFHGWDSQGMSELGCYSEPILLCDELVH